VKGSGYSWVVSPAPFDDAADDYDRRFTNTEIGRVLRKSVWRHLDNVLTPGSRVLELGCGTGEDARWLAGRGHRVLATDASPSMLEQARRKIGRAGLTDRVRFAQLDLAGIAVEPDPPGAPFDGVLSNFGALNCLPSCADLAAVLHRWLKPGARMVFVVMGPFCLWEWAWYGLRLQPRTALRRLRSGQVVGVGAESSVRVWYPSPGRLRRQLQPWFEVREVMAIGALVPPPYADAIVRDRPELLRRLAALEERFGRRLSWLSDHYLLSLERVDDAFM